MMLFEIPYNRAAAVEYANRWAYFRNPEFYDFSAIGGEGRVADRHCQRRGQHIQRSSGS